jgi:class 3 adenylate cyclase
MLATLASYRAATGLDVHCRIGIASGEVIAGVLGRLQPR